MPYELQLPGRLRRSGWKVKIRDKERVEPPHVTMIRGADEWRIGLRDGTFLVPPGGSWSDVDKDVRNAVGDAWCELRCQWDSRYPENPVGGTDG